MHTSNEALYWSNIDSTWIQFNYLHSSKSHFWHASLVQMARFYQLIISYLYMASLYGMCSFYLDIIFLYRTWKLRGECLYSWVKTKQDWTGQLRSNGIGPSCLISNHGGSPARHGTSVFEWGPWNLHVAGVRWNIDPMEMWPMGHFSI